MHETTQGPHEPKQEPQNNQDQNDGFKGIARHEQEPPFVVSNVYSMSSPCRRATSKQSLSPRPEKQITTISSLSRRAAWRIPSTTACAVSSAGRIPSRRLHG